MRYTHSLNFPFLLLMVLLLFEGCVSSPLITQPPKTQSVEEIKSPAPTQALTPTLALTFTPISSQLSTTTTPTQAPSSTIPNQTPTLTDPEREIFIMELLKTNADCELPCWWGIVPGETTWNETLQFLNEVGESTSPIPQSDGTIVHWVGGFDIEKMKMYNHVSFYEESGLIDGIEVRSEGHIPEDFEKIWERYAPKQVFEMYGQPSRIWINSEYSYGKSDNRSYGLWLFYDEIGFLIIYSGVVEFNPTYHICPFFDNPTDIQTINLYLQSSEDKRPLERFTDYSDKLDYIKPIEAGGLTIDELYSIFIEEEQPCFDFPGNIFP